MEAQKSFRNSVCLTFNITEQEYLNDIKELFDKYNFSFYYHFRDNRIDIKINSRQLADFLRNFGEYSHGKLLPEWAVNLPFEYLYELLYGYWRGDGHWDQLGRGHIVSINTSLLYNIRRAFLRIGVVAGLKVKANAGTNTILGKDVNRSKIYSLNFSLENINWRSCTQSNIIFKHSRKYGYIENGKAYIKVKYIRQEDYDGLVYDIQTKSNDFLVNYLTVHNCDDLTGRILNLMNSGEEKEKWEHLCFPAIAEQDEPPEPVGLGRKKGEVLWPEMWPLDQMLAKKNSGTLSSYHWSALYQQNPVPAGGGFFKSEFFRYYEHAGEYFILKTKADTGDVLVHEDDCWTFITADTANKPKRTSDYTVIMVWSVTKKNDLILRDIYRKQAGYDEVIKQMILWCRYYKAEYIGIENMGTAIQMINELRDRGFATRALEPRGKGKDNRANSPMGAVVKMQSGKIFFPIQHPLLKDLELELLNFPKGARDDAVDCLAYAANELSKVQGNIEQDFRPYSIANTGVIRARSPQAPGFFL
jgi:predicted phage terminase large subunit-like protein